MSNSVWGSEPFVPVSLPRQPVLWGPVVAQDGVAHPYASSRIELFWMEMEGKESRGYGASSHLGGQASPKHPFIVMYQPRMGYVQGKWILLQILCWLRFLIQCFSECIHSPTEIEPCALGVTIICLILNKTFGKHVSLFSCWKWCCLPTSNPANVK